MEPEPILNWVGLKCFVASRTETFSHLSKFPLASYNWPSLPKILIRIPHCHHWPSWNIWQCRNIRLIVPLARHADDHVDDCDRDRATWAATVTKTSNWSKVRHQTAIKYTEEKNFYRQSSSSIQKNVKSNCYNRSIDQSVNQSFNHSIYYHAPESWPESRPT